MLMNIPLFKSVLTKTRSIYHPTTVIVGFGIFAIISNYSVELRKSVIPDQLFTTISDNAL